MAGDLPHRSGTLRLNDFSASPSRPSPVGRFLASAPPEALFVLSAIAQYVGATVAIDLFDEVNPATVAWLRVIGASLALTLVSLPRIMRRISRAEFLAMAMFGTFTALMNTFFYLAVDRLPLGKGVTIEFIGPIIVAALRTRSSRNAFALLLAVVGVVVLSGVELGGEPLGLVFIFLASAMWAGYIVVGSKVAQLDHGVAGLGIGLAVGALVISPLGAPHSGDVWGSPRLLGLCLFVGIFSSAIGYGIDQYTLRRIPVRRFSVLLALLPVVAVLTGFVALDQRPTLVDLLGMAFVLTGVVVQERDELPTPTEQ